ncbi:U1 snRNP protein [Friedmanniomyces endolithicus]|uniref:U1 snRNP protein n=1 Tax=Friedmanniomyces endolithicus TaxID=329885 RepID=A0AAN6KP88_9PEZI|nr:U1 snRNP protein [Friedmanniomyces endolithicus]KAK0293253.1 U1 snRNP protein [Friedmanniomyces endolithicus]KAK0306876.1 U1 snRNP protein [Friedmanniomyces endolithicus]KAK0991460.1 U1 snRNP protein [Friedmanniomyces endolithicus]KAK0993119.1 U1 snRNP protein [Friedmanniomyces endolithicus]
MSGWKEAKAADGRSYYFHAETKETTWVKPDDYEAVPVAADPAAVDAAWKETRTAEGKPYYYNSITKVTVWDPPEAFVRHQQQNAPPEAAFVAGGGVGYGGARDEYPSRERRMERRGDREHLPQKPSFDGGRGGEGGKPWERRQDNAGFRGPMPEKTDEPEYATLEQAEEAFFAMLKKHSITPESSWEDALRLVIRDREYRALKDPKERRQAFEKYCVEVRAQEKGKEKERREKLREEFRKMLGTHDDIKHYTRWTTARPLVEREAVFKQAGDEDERHHMFDEYIVELKRRHAEEDFENHKTAMQEMSDLLKTLVVEPDTTWADAQKAITENERFTSEDIFRTLHMVDILTAFESHIKELDYERNDAKQKEKRLHTRRERQARDAFRQLLAQMLEEGKIKAGTKWQDFHPLIASDERYTRLIGTPGSSALDLFWDVVEDEERKLRSDRNHALDVLEDQRYEMTVQTTIDDFSGVMQSDPRTASFAPELLQMIYDRLMEKIWKRAEEEKLNLERSQRKAIDALRSVIKHLDPPVRSSDTYEDLAPRLASYEEFRVLDDDEARRSAFEKHMRRVKEKEADDLERERSRRDRDRDHRSSNGAVRRERGEVDRDRRHRTRTPEVDAYEADRRKAQAVRERLFRKPSFGITPPPRERERERERRDDRYPADERRRNERAESIYDRERREREMERERNYISRADPRDKGRTLDYGDEETVAAGSRPGSVRKRRESDGSAVANQTKRARRTRTPEPEGVLKEEPPALQSGSEEGEIEEV